MIIPIKLEKRTEGEQKAYAEGYAAGKRDAVRHGRWIEASAHDPCDYRCAGCGWLADDEYHYCPNCGAEMSNATQHTGCVENALGALNEAEPEDTYCTEESCPIYQNDLSCERCNR